MVLTLEPSGTGSGAASANVGPGGINVLAVIIGNRLELFHSFSIQSLSH